MTDATLLVELQTEELPPKSLQRLGEAFADQIVAEIVRHRFKTRDPSKQVFATPRRIGVVIADVLERASESHHSFEGPSSSNSKAVTGFAGKHKIAPEALERRKTAKGEIVVANVTLPGVYLDSVLPRIVEDALKKLPIPKVMRWGSGEAQFVRPVHGLVMLHGNKIVPGTVLGLESGRSTRGHRFMGKSEITLANADEYEKKLLAEGMVVADFVTRRGQIEKFLEQKAKEQKANLGEYQSLLDEVTALVEHPSVYVGEFDKAFLEVPQECLILTMRQNQKYFPLFDTAGRLLPKFLIVSNMQVADSRHIIGGNQRVVRPRLEDARFFFNQDRKRRLEERVPELGKVVYHNKLGSQLDRVQRIKLLAGNIARDLGADTMLAERASELSKADLLTGMVGEFPELQGIMGRHYALHDREPAAVADAIEAHYWPRFAGDRLPEGPIACAVSLADKIDTIVGIFGIGLMPTGDRDPFALRRHSLGVLRILCERQLRLDLGTMLKSAHFRFPEGVLKDSHERDRVSIPNHVEAYFFIKDRAKSYLRDLGYTVLEVESVLDLDPMPCEYVSRLDAARAFLTLPEAIGLAEADKRIRNILTKSGAASVIQRADEAKFQIEPERHLSRTTRLLRSQVDKLLVESKFKEALLLTAQIHQPVTIFFEKVMVNVDDKTVQLNRFALLHEVVNLTNRVANISKLAI